MRFASTELSEAPNNFTGNSQQFATFAWLFAITWFAVRSDLVRAYRVLCHPKFQGTLISGQTFFLSDLEINYRKCVRMQANSNFTTIGNNKSRYLIKREENRVCERHETCHVLDGKSISIRNLIFSASCSLLFNFSVNVTYQFAVWRTHVCHISIVSRVFAALDRSLSCDIHITVWYKLPGDIFWFLKTLDALIHSCELILLTIWVLCYNPNGDSDLRPVRFL